jgi:excisionase family DNA binding protein
MRLSEIPLASSVVSQTTCNKGPAARDDEFKAVSQVATILNVSYSSVLGSIHNGSLPAYKFGPHGGTYRVRLSDLCSYIAMSRTKQSPSQPKTRKTGTTFKKLDGERLLRAWREQGVSAERCEEGAE